MYNAIFDAEAIDFLNELPEKLRKRIFGKILAAKENPFHYFERLKGREDFRLRVGDYSVIADISQKTMEIKITLIGHRKNVYVRKA
jgi:mRNA interferase RelE/StbE